MLTMTKPKAEPIGSAYSNSLAFAAAFQEWLLF